MGTICPCMRPADSGDVFEPLMNDQTSDEEEIKDGEEHSYLNRSREDVKPIGIRDENDKISYSRKISINDFTFFKVPFYVL